MRNHADDMDRLDIVHYPQDEMTTILLPVSRGCPYNQCAFCTMYEAQLQFNAIVMVGLAGKDGSDGQGGKLCSGRC